MGEDEAHWRRALEQSRSAPFAPDGLRKAADQALESGFLQYAFDIRPHVMPEFLAQYVHSPDSRDATRETNTALSSSAGHLTRAEQTVDTMPSTRDGIARAIEKRSPVDIDGTSFTLTLTELKKSLPHEVKYIEVLFMALSTDARHNGMLHIGPDNYTDDEIADLAVNTIRDIVRGKLPPGTSSLI